MSHNKRSEPRIPIQLEVEVITPELGKLQLQTTNMSSNGLYLCTDQRLALPVGSEIMLRLTQPLGDGEPPLIHARVVRVEEHGFGLQFLEDEEE